MGKLSSWQTYRVAPPNIDNMVFLIEGSPVNLKPMCSNEMPYYLIRCDEVTPQTKIPCVHYFGLSNCTKHHNRKLVHYEMTLEFGK